MATQIVRESVILICMFVGMLAGAESKQQEEFTAHASSEQQADLLMARQKYQAAIEAYIQIPTKSAIIWNKLGIAYQHMYAVDEALINYEHALQINPNYPDAINNLGTIFFAKRDYRRAEKLYRKAIKLAPGDAVILKNLGTSYFAEEKATRGAEEYRAAFAIDPHIFDKSNVGNVAEPASPAQRANLHFCMAEVYARARKNELALEFLRQSLSEGYKDHKRLFDDQSFAELRKDPAYSQLILDEKIR